MHDRFYSLKIYLADIKPQIWRRFVVPAFVAVLTELAELGRQIDEIHATL